MKESTSELWVECVQKGTLHILLKSPITKKTIQFVTIYGFVIVKRIEGSLVRGTRLRVNICKRGLNNFRLFLCLSLAWCSSGWETEVASFSTKSEKNNCTRMGQKKRDEFENGKANQINLIIKNPHKMDWSLKMPFVLSLFLSFYAAFTLRLSYLFSLGWCFVLFLLFFLPLFEGWRKSIFFLWIRARALQWRLITSKRQINKQTRQFLKETTC